MKKDKSKTPRKDSTQYRFLQKFGKQITEYEAFQRAVEGKNPTTQYNYSTRIPDFFVYLDEDPDTVIMNRQKDISSNDLLQVERYERKVKSYVQEIEKHRSVAPILLCIQGFFTNNSKRLQLDLKKMKYAKSRKKRKYSPTVDEVKKLIAHADCSRDKLIVALAYHHGLASIDVANFKIGEYPDKPWVHFVKAREKSGEDYHGVSTPDTCKFMRDYLVVRKGQEGEPLLMGREGVLDAASVSVILTSLINRSGLNSIKGFIPYCLRDGLNDALIDANVYLSDKEMIMGHNTSSIYHQYGSEKRLEERIITSMKKVYPLICLSDNSDVINESLSKEDVVALKEGLKQLNEILALRNAGDLLDVNDPFLLEKLRAKGKL